MLDELLMTKNANNEVSSEGLSSRESHQGSLEEFSFEVINDGNLYGFVLDQFENKYVFPSGRYEGTTDGIPFTMNKKQFNHYRCNKKATTVNKRR